MRAAGDSGTYEFVLLNKGTGKLDPHYKIELATVTTIIKATLAAPEIVGWAYRMTRDNIAGLLDTLSNEMRTSSQEIVDMFSDADDLEEYLKEQRLRPVDIRDERGEQGHEEHKALERLCNVALSAGDEEADLVAKGILSRETETGYSKAIADWWLHRSPEVIVSEQFLFSLEHKFAGTVDLIYRDLEGNVVICDLKTRKLVEECKVNHKTEDTKRRCLGCNPRAYDSDHIQTGAYDIAWGEMEGKFADKRTVLMIRPDGKWQEEESTIDRSAFLDLLAVYEKIKGGE